MTQLMKVPPVKSSKQYHAVSIMTIPEYFLKKNVNIYLLGKFDNQVKICGAATAIQKDLILLLIEKTKKRLFLPVRSYPEVKMGRCQIEIGTK